MPEEKAEKEVKKPRKKRGARKTKTLFMAASDGVSIEEALDGSGDEVYGPFKSKDDAMKEIHGMAEDDSLPGFNLDDHVPAKFIIYEVRLIKSYKLKVIPSAVRVEVD